MLCALQNVYCAVNCLLSHHGSWDVRCVTWCAALSFMCYAFCSTELYCVLRCLVMYCAVPCYAMCAGIALCWAICGTVQCAVLSAICSTMLCWVGVCFAGTVMCTMMTINNIIYWVAYVCYVFWVFVYLSAIFGTLPSLPFFLLIPKGQTVYSLCVGEPDYPPPSEVIIATVC